MLRAGREAEDAAIGFLKAQERAQLPRRQRRRRRADGRDHATTSTSEGVIDFTPVFLFEGTLAEQQDQLAVAQGQIALSLVDLYRALGGGWEMRLQDAAQPGPRRGGPRPARRTMPARRASPRPRPTQPG